MRLIGHLKSESSAKTLADYLISVDIRNQIEPDAEGWGIWVYSEDQIEAGRAALASYVSNPADSKFQNAARNAAVIDERQRREKASYDKRVHTAGELWMAASLGTATLTLIIISVIVTLLFLWDPTSATVDWLFISRNPFVQDLPEVRQGQIWRLITPIFIHFGVPHIVFNMLMLRDFGSLIESRQGAKVLLALAVVIGIGSNLGQYFYGGPDFGGMSGVLYGLLGYVWLRSHCDPASGLYLAPMTLTIMLVWFFLCLFGIIPHEANACHAYGLGMGMMIGAAPMVKRIFD
jgi:GlpG protein